jgi:hypothetical protein
VVRKFPFEQSNDLIFTITTPFILLMMLPVMLFTGSLDTSRALFVFSSSLNVIVAVILAGLVFARYAFWMRGRVK